MFITNLFTNLYYSIWILRDFDKYSVATSNALE